MVMDSSGRSRSARAVDCSLIGLGGEFGDEGVFLVSREGESGGVGISLIGVGGESAASDFLVLGGESAVWFCSCLGAEVGMHTGGAGAGSEGGTNFLSLKEPLGLGPLEGLAGRCSS